jgi:aminomethyltransferase
MAKRTALYDEHVRLGGRIIDFGGWDLPVQYSGVIDEHLTCRSAGGLFDVSHMGEVHVEGPDAEGYLNYLVSNDVRQMVVGRAQYTAMCNEAGGVVDDLIIYKRSAERFLVVVNASNAEKDFAHMQAVQEQYKGGAARLKLTNESERYSQIAIQGRVSVRTLQPLTSVELSAIKTYHFAEGTVLAGVPAIIARTGYTGEDGFEVYVPWERGPELWRELLREGSAHGLKPCGLGARDTLRLEMKYALYGHELTEETNPLEAGLGWVVKLDKGPFVGRSPILHAKEQGLRRKLIGLRFLERGIPRQGYAVFSADGATRIGEVTSGTQSPSLKQSIGIAYVEAGYAATGTRLTVDIRGVKIPAEIVPTPFYKRDY